MTAAGIRLLACRCVLRLGEGALPVDPAAMLRRCRGVYLRAADPGGACGGLTAADGQARAVVVCDPRMDPVQLRWTLAHELGHVALRHAEAPARRPREEAEAELFARELLMPAPLLNWLAESRGALWAEQLRAVFGVPLAEARRVRLPAPETPAEIAAEVVRLLAPAAETRMPARVMPGWHPINTNNIEQCK